MSGANPTPTPDRDRDPNPYPNPEPNQADYERRNQLLESRKRGQGLRLCDHYAAQAALPVDAGLRRPLPASRSMPELPAAWSPWPPSNPKPYTEP